MKKILSFILLGLMCSIGSVWAQVTPAAPATKSYGGKTFLDVMNTPGNAGDNNSYVNYGVILMYNNYSGWDWFSCDKFDKSNNSYSLPTGAVGFHAPGSSSSSDFYGNINFNANNKTANIDIYVTGTTEVGFIYQNNNTSNDRWINITIKKVGSDGNDTGDALLSLENNGTSLQYQAKSSLDGDTYYHVKMTTSGESTSKFYSITFKKATGSDPEPGGDPVDPTITFNNGAYTVGGDALDLSTLFTSNSTGAVTYSVKTEGGTGAAIAGTSFTATAAGTAVVTASQAAAAGYNAKSVDANIVVSAAAPQPAAGDVVFSADVVATSAQSFASGTTAITDAQATIDGGSMSAINQQSSAKNLISAQSDVFYFTMTNNNTFFKVELNQALVAGDIISADVLTNGSGEGNKRGIWVSTATSRPNDAPDAALTAISATGKEAVNVSYEVVAGDEYEGETILYIYRETANSTYFDNFNIFRPAPSTDPKISASDASILAIESGIEATKDIVVTGQYLTGSTLTATLNPAVAGLSVTLDENTIVSGSISATATLHYTQTVNVPQGQTTLTFSDGTTSKDIIISYTSHVVASAPEQISVATTWDFSELTGVLQFTTNEEKNIEFSYSDLLEITCPPTFNAQGLAFKGEYPFRGTDYKCTQNGILHFITTIPGVLTVDFSDTGNSGDSYERYLNINGSNTEYFTKRTGSGNGRLTVSVAVDAGDIYIKGMKDDGETAAAICVYSLKFTPTAITLGANGYSTYAADFKYTVSGAEVYKAAYNGSNAVVLTEVVDAVVPANQGIILKGTEGATATITLSNDDASDFTGNGLIGVVAPLAASAGMYVLSTNAGITEFNPCEAGLMIPAHKAYISIPSNAPAIRIIFAENGATGINELEGAEKAVKFIENGKLYIQKDGVIYDATGAKVK